MTPDTTPDVETATVRSVVYAFLARSLAHPSAPHRTALSDWLVPALRDVGVDDPVLADAIDTCLDALPADLGTLAHPHARTFPVIESRDCPTYETAYRGHDVFQQGHLMADVAGCYRAHGLRVGGVERERPDHITTELEFMGFLAAQEAYALVELGPEQVESAAATQRLFLREHLGAWAPSFGRRVALVAEHRFHRAVGALLAVWVDSDVSALGIDPVETVDRPLPVEPPDDGACGVAPSEVWPLQLGGRP